MTPPSRSTTAARKTRKPAPPIDRDTGQYQRDPNSVPAQLEALAVGESFARGARIPVDEFMVEEARDWFTKTTRVISMQVARVKERNTKNEFSIERIQGLAHGGEHMLCSIIVTRTA